MKYFAILKDSLREAWDSWVLLGLFVLTTLVILFVASLSFTPQSAEKTMAFFFPAPPFQPNPLIFQVLNERKSEKVAVRRGRWGDFRLKGVELLRGDPDSPLSDYALTVSSERRFADNPMIVHEEGDGPKQPPKEQKRPPVDINAEIKMLRTLFEDADELGYIKLGPIEAIAKGDEDNAPQLFRVVVQGTPKTHRLWATVPGIMFGAYEIEFLSAPLAWRMYWLASWVISVGSYIAVLLGIVITSFFIPNMLRKGTVDLLLVKPISRWLLLVYKYFGGLAFIFLSTAYALGGIWLALGIRSGLWANGASLLIPTITFFFAILYAVSTFVGVVTRSGVTSILLTVAAYGAFAMIGLAYRGVDLIERMEKEDEKMRELFGKEARPEKETPGWLTGTMTAIKIVHAISPRTEDLNQLNDLIVYTDFFTGGLGDMGKFDTSKRNWWESLLVSSIWIGIFLGLACTWFTLKDY